MLSRLSLIEVNGNKLNKGLANGSNRRKKEMTGNSLFYYNPFGKNNSRFELELPMKFRASIH